MTAKYKLLFDTCDKRFDTWQDTSLVQSIILSSPVYL